MVGTQCNGVESVYRRRSGATRHDGNIRFSTSPSNRVPMPSRRCIYIETWELVRLPMDRAWTKKETTLLRSFSCETLYVCMHMYVERYICEAETHPHQRHLTIFITNALLFSIILLNSIFLTNFTTVHAIIEELLRKLS